MIIAFFENNDFWNTFLNSQLLGVLLGGIITALFAWFLDYRKYKREIKIRDYEQKKKCYIEILKLYHLENEKKFCQNQLTPNISEIIKQRRQDLLAEFQIFADNDVLDKWNEVGHDLNGTFKEEDLINLIRKKLGVNQ